MEQLLAIDASPRFLFEPRRKSNPPQMNIPPSQGNVNPKYKYSITPNLNCAWLTYESFFNHEVFQHTNAQLNTLSYSMPLKDVQVVLASNLTPHNIEQIRQAFFPELDTDTLQRIAYCPWIPGRVLHPIQVEGKNVRMPYNFVANDIESLALATRANPQGECQMKRLSQQWMMWQTASRSCVIRLNSIGPAEIAPDTQDAFSATVADKWMRVLWDFRLQNENSSVEKNNPFDLGDMYDPQEPTLPKYFSLKTGAYRIGKDVQADKNTLEADRTAIVGALNSEWINVLKICLKGQAKALSTQIVILPEILTVTCTNVAIDGGANDGFQLRDLSQMNPKNKYFPPISIPYVGPIANATTPINFVTRVSGWSALLSIDGNLDNAWIHHWSQNFAAKMGRTKAILHLCYGLQCLTPNSQNFLLEYSEKMEPTGGIFLRDVIDMKLHTDWVRTLMGCAEPKSSLKTFFDVGVKHMDSRLYNLLHFEATTLSPKPTRVVGAQRMLIQDAETFENLMDPSGKDIQYYKDTQINWFAYTSLFNGIAAGQTNVNMVTATRPKPRNWQDALAINTYWGFIHAQSYIALINEYLHLNIPNDAAALDQLTLDYEDDGGREKLLTSKIKYLTKGLQDTIVEAPASENRPFLFMANLYTIWGLKDDPDGLNRARELHRLYMQWDRRVSKMIHTYMYGDEGKQALKAFHGLELE